MELLLLQSCRIMYKAMLLVKLHQQLGCLHELQSTSSLGFHWSLQLPQQYGVSHSICVTLPSHFPVKDIMKLALAKVCVVVGGGGAAAVVVLLFFFFS